MKTYTPEVLYQVENLLNIGIALSAEKNHNRILEMILLEARKITQADAGTIYLLENDELVFKITHNETLKIFKGADDGPVGLPNVRLNKEYVTAYVALTKKSVNIADLRNNGEFDFSGPCRYEELTGYQSISMLVIPMENHEGKVIGVLQLINALDSAGKVIPFASHFEKVVSSLASQAAICLSNAQYLQEIEKLLHSFVEVMAMTIDARSPYNANHTRRVAQMSGELARFINGVKEGPFAKEYFDEERITQLVLAAWLHDIGKIATPSNVMDKASRLEGKLDLILQRFEYIAAEIKLIFFEQLTVDELSLEKRKKLENDCSKKLQYVEFARNLIQKINNPATIVTIDVVQDLQKIATETYLDWSGERKPWLTSDELNCLSVIKGTLTDVERGIMEEHVQITQRILEIIPFPYKLRNVPHWAILHHELLDGKGYPKGLLGNEIPLEGRILTLLDIFDALTADDRPYKKAMSANEALCVLEMMVNNGKIDGEIYRVFSEGQIWKCLVDVKPNFLASQGLGT